MQARGRPYLPNNNMNAIAAPRRIGPGRDEEVVEGLADLFRVTRAESTPVSAFEGNLRSRTTANLLCGNNKLTAAAVGPLIFPADGS